MERSTVGSLLRSTQAFCSQLCEKQTLDNGIAYYQPRFPKLAELNQFREVVVEDASRLPTAFEAAERWFSDLGLCCFRWAPAGGVAVPALADFLQERGFTARTYSGLLLARWETFAPHPDFRVLHARAMRAAFHETVLATAGPSTLATARSLSEAYAERLDDPQFDMFIAMVDRMPAGRCALYQVGDIARLMDLAVVPQFADLPVADALAAHTLAMAKRLQMRQIVAQVDDSDAGTIGLFERFGFVRDGTTVEFERRHNDAGA